MGMQKAIVAAVMSGLFLLNHFLGIDFGLDEPAVAAAVQAVLAVAMPIVVWFWPNKS